MIKCVWNQFQVGWRLDDELRFCTNSCGKQTYIEKEVIWDQFMFLRKAKISLNHRLTFRDFQPNDIIVNNIIIGKVIYWSGRKWSWSSICRIMLAINSYNYIKSLYFILNRISSVWKAISNLWGAKILLISFHRESGLSYKDIVDGYLPITVWRYAWSWRSHREELS